MALTTIAIVFRSNPPICRGNPAIVGTDSMIFRTTPVPLRPNCEILRQLNASNTNQTHLYLAQNSGY